jgi:16S rRNA (adenine1518-N6/adenine1519-N6)-dimethyltransferase
MRRRSRTQALGQHFLVDGRVLGQIVNAAAIKGDEVVCEAGTGAGILTAELCRRAGRVISYEVDRALYEKARLSLVGFENLQLRNADPFSGKAQELKFDVFVSNLPYSRSRDAIEWLASIKFNRAIVMVQEEFADKLAAVPGEQNYRAISAISGYCFRLERLFSVGSDAFDPPPRVESTVVRLTPVKTLSPDAIKKINRLFSQRNKKASRVAAKMMMTPTAMPGAADFDGKRIDQLEPAQLVQIAEAMP